MANEHVMARDEAQANPQACIPLPPGIKPFHWKSAYPSPGLSEHKSSILSLPTGSPIQDQQSPLAVRDDLLDLGRIGRHDTRVVVQAEDI